MSTRLTVARGGRVTKERVTSAGAATTGGGAIGFTTTGGGVTTACGSAGAGRSTKKPTPSATTTSTPAAIHPFGAGFGAGACIAPSSQVATAAIEGGRASALLFRQAATSSVSRLGMGSPAWVRAGSGGGGWVMMSAASWPKTVDSKGGFPASIS